MARPFFFATANYRVQHVALFDFVHGTTAALWHTRWQVRGYIEAVPDATAADLEARFVLGSGIRGANVKRTFLEQTWDEQRAEVARIVLINSVALYEGWLASVTRRFSGGAWADELQFHSKGVQGRKARGVRDALAGMTKQKSPTMLSDLTPLLRAQPQYRGPELDDLLLIYRYFKEVRNALVHAGGLGTAQLVKAHQDLHEVTTKSARLKEIPEHSAPAAEQPVELSLRGVIGLTAVVIHLVMTIDAELSQTHVAENEFLQRFRERYGTVELPAEQPQRSRRVRSLTKNLGFPEPKSVQKIDELLAGESLTA
ncbi:MAG: hypothetical protein WKF65_08525 [Gaiellaceae bacterium]